ncbi:uncharacterized protein [Oryza sativa Japonica Group]|uniref:Os11g0129800 protein n=1 Tax=Oryza sativa subsp. japonica TaxID=39947 RepID=A0A0P0XYM6_ORYSJ|nr:uncharacterized protein LOC4349668 [Oryza sativa Japonica Group]KAF2909301.1 hypothetical protein DAI22_11g016200 [Oryza sativa Japonica Group]BAT12508.1 Os11g0129800 [Oryza sativa Japonica Group]
MASSAFKSTTRRTLHPAADDRPPARPRKAPPPCPRRSRSASVEPRARGIGEYAAGNTRTNPLFDDSASPPPPQPQVDTEAAGCRGGEARRERGREVARNGSCAGGSGRARSVSLAPRGRGADSSPSWGNGDGGGGRRASRAPSVAVDLQPYRGDEVIWQSNHSNVPVQQVIEIPPEFDPDSSEFVSDISDYTTEFKKEEILHIPFEFDLDRADLAPDIEHHSIELQREQMEIPLDFDPDSAELSPDITEYTTKLKQSHERARKLRADLAVEEQREQELSRVLKGIVTTPNFTEAHKRRPRRKSSVERLKVSKHLAEEAMNYFEECVSISTLDSTDFSSLEDPQINSVVNIPQKSRNTSFNKGGSSIAEIHYPTDRHWHNEESDNQTQCSVSLTGSDVSGGRTFSHNMMTPVSRTTNNSSDDLDGFDTPKSRSSCFSFTHEPTKTVEGDDVQQYLRSFGRGISKDLREIRSSYCDDDYVFQKMNADLLMDIVTFKNRVNFGGLLICNIRR